MKRTLLIILLALVCGTIGWYARQYAPQLGVGDTSKSTAESSSQDGQSAHATSSAEQQATVVGMGRIEPAGGVIDVGAMMGDRLGRLLVEEGQVVEKGKPLAELESRELRKLELEAANGQLEDSGARLDVERRLADVKIEAAKLAVRKAMAAELGLVVQEKKIKLLKVSSVLTKKDQERLNGLSDELVTDQERERQELVVRRAESELESAQTLMGQMVRTNQLGLEAANLELTAAKEAKEQLPFAIPIESLRIKREMAAAQFKRTEVTAPCDGTILKVYVRPGETISSKPILRIADLQRMVVVVEVYENEIKYIRRGRETLVTSKAFRSPYDEKGFKGTVARIGRMIDTPVLRNVDPFAPADRHVVEVRVDLDAEASRQVAALSNLQVDVRFPKGEQGSGAGNQGSGKP